METARSRALAQLAGQMPGQNNQIAQGIQQANAIQMKQYAQQAQPGAGVRQAQQAGAAVAQQAGQQQLGLQKQAGEQANQLGQAGLQSQQAANELNLGQQKLGQAKEAQSLEEQLNGLDSNLKNQLFDQQMQFKQDELGRTQLNERQLQDWAVQKAKSAEDYKNYAQQAQLVYERKNQMMDIALQKLSAALSNEEKGFGQKLDEATKAKLVQMKFQAEKDAQKRQAEAANKAAMWQAGGTILGGAAGAFTGTPQGAMAGASLGGGLGTLAGSQLS